MRPELNRSTRITKNLAAQQEIETRLSTGKSVYKTHKRAKMNGTTTQKEMNPVIEGMYHSILRQVRALYSTLPKSEDRILIEWNNEKDPTDSHGLFTLMTPSFFFYLECDVLNNFKIEYLFHNCPVEADVQKLINQFCMRSYSTESVSHADYPTFFKNCLASVPDRFVHQL